MARTSTPVSTPARPPGKEPQESLSLQRSLELARPMALRAARRSGLQPADAEDFCSVASLSILSKAEKLRRAFRGEAAPGTYLHSVIRNCLRDYLVSELGKWRPSARAGRLGAMACELEKLRDRNGLSDEETFQILRRTWHRPVCREEVEGLFSKLPARTPRRQAAALYEDATVDDDRLGRMEGKAAPEPVADALRSALASLPPADLLLLRRHFVDGTPISRLARQLAVRQRSLYTRKDRALRRLRRSLQAKGIDWSAAREALERFRAEFYVGLLSGFRVPRKDRFLEEG